MGIWAVLDSAAKARSTPLRCRGGGGGGGDTSFVLSSRHAHVEFSAATFRLIAVFSTQGDYLIHMAGEKMLKFYCQPQSATETHHHPVYLSKLEFRVFGLESIVRKHPPPSRRVSPSSPTGGYPHPVPIESWEYPHPAFTCVSLVIFADHVRSMGDGNVFTSLCDSVQGEEQYL